MCRRVYRLSVILLLTGLCACQRLDRDAGRSLDGMGAGMTMGRAAIYFANALFYFD